MALAYVDEPLVGGRAGGEILSGREERPRRTSVVSGLIGAGIADPFRYLLLLRFALLNITAVALIGAAWGAGWLDGMIATDKYHLIKLNILVFLFGMGLCGWRIVQLSHELNELHGERFSDHSRVGQYLQRTRLLDGAGRAALAETLKMKLGVRLGSIRHIASTIVLLGLVGTVIGFIIALSGVDQDAAKDASAITPMISTLLLGMSIALYKTLVGSILNVWLMMAYRLLEAGTVHLVTGVIELGEARRARL